MKKTLILFCLLFLAGCFSSIGCSCSKKSLPTSPVATQTPNPTSKSWVATNIGLTSGSINDLQIFDQNDGWACGGDGSVGVIYRYNGSSWVKLTTPTITGTWSLNAIAPVDAEHCYIAGTSSNSGSYYPVIIYCNGTTCSISTNPAAPDLSAYAGSLSILNSAYFNGSLYIGGTVSTSLKATGTILYKYSNSAWSSDIDPYTWGTAGNPVHMKVAGDGSAVWYLVTNCDQLQCSVPVYITEGYKDTGSGFASVNIEPGLDPYYGAWFMDANNGWCIGQDGNFNQAIFQILNNNSTEITTSGTTLQAIMQDVDGMVWVATSDGIYYHPQGTSSWQLHTSVATLGQSVIKFGKYGWAATNARELLHLQ